LGYDDAKIQSTTENVDGRDVQGFQMQTETLQPPEQRELRRALDERFGVIDESYGLELVGPTFGEQIIRNAIWAILLSFAVIVVYLTIRFEYKLALPALLTVVHDLWLSIAVYSVTGREVTSATVAALLTILGYSLYDVVIVFDRIRENVPIMRRSTYREIVNTSVHETLTRSFITMLTTLIPLTVLYFFGGDTLRDFAFALIVGILAGGLSSIGIAAPLAALWKEREPENKRRTTKIERRRATAIATDSDVVDNEALARAEAALDAELRAEAGLERADDEDEYDELEEEPAQIEAGREEPEAEAEEEPEPEAGEEPEPEPEGEPVAAADDANGADGSADGDAQEVEAAGAKEPGNGTRRARPDPNRQRRHRQVQRKRRR
jgi:SecD/SecF fusion protein